MHLCDDKALVIGQLSLNKGLSSSWTTFKVWELSNWTIELKQGLIKQLKCLNYCQQPAQQLKILALCADQKSNLQGEMYMHKPYPCSPPFVSTIIHRNWSPAKTGKAWEHSSHEWHQVDARVDVKWRGAQLLKQCSRLTVQVLYCIFGLQTLAWLKPLVFIGKKLVFKFKYVHIWISAPHLLCLTLRLLMWWMFPGLLFFFLSSTPVYYCQCKRKLKTGEVWERSSQHHCRREIWATFLFVV